MTEGKKPRSRGFKRRKRGVSIVSFGNSRRAHQPTNSTEGRKLYKG